MPAASPGRLLFVIRCNLHDAQGSTESCTVSTVIQPAALPYCSPAFRQRLVGSLAGFPDIDFAGVGLPGTGRAAAFGYVFLQKLGQPGNHFGRTLVNEFRQADGGRQVSFDNAGVGRSLNLRKMRFAMRRFMMVAVGTYA